MSSKHLLTAIVSVLIISAINTVFAIVNKLPYEFGGVGDPNNVARDFITKGTAISPPLIPLVLLVIFAWLTFRPGWLGLVGYLGIILLGMVFVFAGLQEPIISRTLQARPLSGLSITVLVLSVLGSVSALLMILFAILGLRARNRMRQNPAPSS